MGILIFPTPNVLVLLFEFSNVPSYYFITGFFLLVAVFGLFWSRSEWRSWKPEETQVIKALTTFENTPFLFTDAEFRLMFKTLKPEIKEGSQHFQWDESAGKYVKKYCESCLSGDSHQNYKEIPLKPRQNADIEKQLPPLITYLYRDKIV